MKPPRCVDNETKRKQVVQHTNSWVEEDHYGPGKLQSIPELDNYYNNFSLRGKPKTTQKIKRKGSLNNIKVFKKNAGGILYPPNQNGTNKTKQDSLLLPTKVQKVLKIPKKKKKNQSHNIA